MPHYVYVGVPQWTATESAGMLGGLFRQEVGAAEWQHLTTGLPDKVEVRTIAIHPRDSRIVYVGTQYGPYRSTDRGESWRELEIWRFSPFAYGRDIQAAPDDPRTLYAALSPAAMSQVGSIYRSQDLGETWQRFDRHVTPRRTMMSVAVSRRNPRCVYGVNSIGQVFGTSDGGETWQEFPLPAGLRNVYTVACA